MIQIAILHGHGELITPEAVEYSRFLGILARERAVLRSVKDTDAPLDLRGAHALLIGRPTEPIPEDTIAAIRAWVLTGGRLFLTSGAGGDRPPGKHGLGGTNLSRMVDGLTFQDDVVHWESEMEAGENLVVSLDLASLGGTMVGASLDYVSGCTFEVATEHPVLARLDAATFVGALCFPRPVLEYDDVLTGDPQGTASAASGTVFVELAVGLGWVGVLGSTSSFHDDFLRPSAQNDPRNGRVNGSVRGNRRFLDHVLFRWLHGTVSNELARRKKDPQRHRLLQGYPMPKLMEEQGALGSGERAPVVPRRPRSSTRGSHEPPWYDELWPGRYRDCVVGVLPHPFCNPTVRGCGFCTFPQEKLARQKMPALVEAVRDDIAAFRQHTLGGARMAIPALYFGGATANLTPAVGFETLCDEISRTFDTRGAEITLEGVPRYFFLEGFRLMRSIRERFVEATPRISMGVQTFDHAQIERMGRTGFGDRREIERLVTSAHDMGFSVSCDLMINLPGQTLVQMLEDIEIAAGAGFDQICVYHLVLFEGLGTPWSEDRHVLSLLHENDTSFSHQRLCRKRLYELGFTQTTLTNFERREGQRPRFRYEPLGFQPDRCDLLGFGPAAISLASSKDFQRAWKVVQDQGSTTFLRGVQRRFFYDSIDMRLLFLTRSIAALEIDTARYARLFGAPVQKDFSDEISALLDRGLLRDRVDKLALSTEGMFFADAVAGLLAWRRVQVLRDRIDDAPRGHERVGSSPHLRFHDPNLTSYGSMG